MQLAPVKAQTAQATNTLLQILIDK